MRTIKLLLLLFVFSVFSTNLVIATQIAKPITYQGKLLDANNLPVTDDVTMTFSIYNSQSDGTKIWPTSGEVEKLVSVSKGLYSIKLGTGEGDDIPLSASVLSGTNAYLQVSIGGNVLSRTAINHVPYSIVSEQITAEGWANPGAIGSTNPNTAKFTSTETETLKVTTGAGDGKVLTSDVNGNATWQDPNPGVVNLQTGITGTLAIDNGGTGSNSLSGLKQNLNFGTMADQNSDNVSISGGSISGSVMPIQLDNVQIGSYLGGSSNTGNFYQLTAQYLDVSMLRLGYGYNNYGYNQPLIIGYNGEVRPSDYIFAYAPQTAYVENQYITTSLTDIEFDIFFDPYGYNNYNNVQKIGSTNQINFGLANTNYYQYNEQFYEITFTADVETDDNSDAATFLIVKNDTEIIGSANLSTWDSTILSTISNTYNQINKSCTVTILTNFSDYDDIKVVGVANGNLTVKKAHLSFRLLNSNY